MGNYGIRQFSDIQVSFISGIFIGSMFEPDDGAVLAMLQK